MLITENFGFLTSKMSKLWLFTQNWLFEVLLEIKLATKYTKNIIFYINDV